MKHLLILPLIITQLFAQLSVDQALDKNRSALYKVKNEIKELKRQITRANIQSSSTLEQIKNIDKELFLIAKSKKLLQKEATLLKNKIGITRTERDIRQKRLDELRDHYARYVVHTYKHGRVQDLYLLLNSSSLNQSLIRAKYLQYFTEHEKRLINKIRFELEKINHLDGILRADLAALDHSFQEKELQEQEYLAKKDQKKVLVSRLKWNAKNLSKQLQDKEAEYQKLRQLILALERQREQREKSGEQPAGYALDFEDFRKNKGKLPWPVSGKILHKYGKQRNVKLKTTINNTGIDIRAQAGSKVKAIFTGIVSMITYLSGYGNTIIIDHGGGYYSVYSHLDEILVDYNDLVEAEEVIGFVGDSGSLEGAKLHFALFSSQKTENPQTWLRN